MPIPDSLRELLLTMTREERFAALRTLCEMLHESGWKYQWKGPGWKPWLRAWRAKVIRGNPHCD